MIDTLQILRDTWDRMRDLPGGRRALSKFVGTMAPYTGTISPEILELERGFSRVQMKDRRGVRNHLKSIHAVALMNLAEAASGLAFVYGLPPQTRAILTGLSIDYLKKARGTLVAECTCDPPATNQRQEVEIEVITRDASGEIVTRARAKWLVGPL